MAATRTVLQLITRAMRTAGVLASGETLTTDEQNDALLILNQMLDGWQADKLYTYCIQLSTFPLVSGTAMYNIGPTSVAPDFPYLPGRPVQIDYAFTRDISGYDRPINIMPVEQFSQIPLKSVGNTFPTTMLYTAAYPTGSIRLYPVPGANLTLNMGFWVPISEFTDVGQTVILPPGYEQAIVFTLCELYAIDNSLDADPATVKKADEYRALIRGMNLPELRSVVEFAGVGGEGQYGTYADFIAGNL